MIDENETPERKALREALIASMNLIPTSTIIRPVLEQQSRCFPLPDLGDNVVKLEAPLFQDVIWSPEPAEVFNIDDYRGKNARK